jgi:hypothetical protein
MERRKIVMEAARNGYLKPMPIIRDERILPFPEKNHGKGAEVREGIGHEVKDPRNSQIIPAQRQQNIFRVGDVE